MAITVLLPVLLGLCLRTSSVEVSLRATAISTSDSEAIDVNDIGEYVRESDDYTNALLCRSERPSGEVRAYSNWFVDPDGDSPVYDLDNRLTDETYEIFGWVRNRTIDSEDRRIAYLRRLSATALEGYFTCHIFDDNNDRRGLYILYPLTVLLSIEVLSGRQGTYRVTCTASGGRLSNSSLTGPGLSSGLSLQRVGSSSDRGQNTYSRTSDTLSEDVGAVYTCIATNNVSSPETSLVLTEEGDPTLIQLVQISPTSVRVTWSPPSDGATVTGYTVHYTRDDGSADRISALPPSTTSTDITGLTNGRTYNISVEATANGLSGESEEMTITLRPPDPPEGVTVADLGPATVRVSWQAVEDADRYTVTFTQATGDDQQGLCSASHSASVSVDTTSASIDVARNVGVDATDMLRAYTTYFITVIAESDVLGTSEDSECAEHTTTQTRAGEAPSSVAATAQSSTVISVQWDGIPTCRLINGLIVKYRVQYTARPNGRVQSTDQTTDDWRSGEETSLTGLTPFTNYSIQVAAVNEEKDVGVFSDSITEQTGEHIPGTVDIVPIPSFFNITLTWEEPAMPNGVITDYEVSYRPTGSSQPVTRSRTVLETSFTTSAVLDPGTSFTFTVRAFTSVGAGDITTITVSTLTRPPAVEGVTATSLTDTSVNVSWNALIIPNFSIDNYTVIYSPVSQSHRRQDGEMTAVFPGSVTSGVITGLDPALNYRFQVFATVTVDGMPLEGERSTPDTTSAVNVSNECESTTCSGAPIIIGVVSGIIGVVVGTTSGLVIAAVTYKKHRAVCDAGKAGVSTDVNPAYGLCDVPENHTEGHYEIPQYIESFPVGAQLETV